MGIFREFVKTEKPIQGISNKCLWLRHSRVNPIYEISSQTDKTSFKLFDDALGPNT